MTELFPGPPASSRSCWPIVLVLFSLCLALLMALVTLAVLRKYWCVSVCWGGVKLSNNIGLTPLYMSIYNIKLPHLSVFHPFWRTALKMSYCEFQFSRFPGTTGHNLETSIWQRMNCMQISQVCYRQLEINCAWRGKPTVKIMVNQQVLMRACLSTWQGRKWDVSTVIIQVCLLRWACVFSDLTT